jgi:translation initiation factor IF-2
MPSTTPHELYRGDVAGGSRRPPGGAARRRSAPASRRSGPRPRPGGCPGWRRRSRPGCAAGRSPASAAGAAPPGARPPRRLWSHLLPRPRPPPRPPGRRGAPGRPGGGSPGGAGPRPADPRRPPRGGRRAGAPACGRRRCGLTHAGHTGVVPARPGPVVADAPAVRPGLAVRVALRPAGEAQPALAAPQEVLEEVLHPGAAPGPVGVEGPPGAHRLPQLLREERRVCDGLPAEGALAGVVRLVGQELGQVGVRPGEGVPAGLGVRVGTPRRRKSRQISARGSPAAYRRAASRSTAASSGSTSGSFAALTR